MLDIIMDKLPQLTIRRIEHTRIRTLCRSEGNGCNLHPTHSVGGSRNFKTGGGGSRCGRILRSKVCFDAPSHIPYVLVRRVVNNNYKIEVFAYIQWFTKTSQTGGGGGRLARRSWIRLCTHWHVHPHIHKLSVCTGARFELWLTKVQFNQYMMHFFYDAINLTCTPLLQ